MLEWFGLDHFATNFGFLNLAPVFSGQILNLAFGQIYDHNRSPADSSRGLCTSGMTCYRDAFRITITASALAIGLAGVLVYRHRPIKHLATPEPEDSERTRMLPSPSSTT